MTHTSSHPRPIPTALGVRFKRFRQTLLPLLTLSAAIVLSLHLWQSPAPAPHLADPHHTLVTTPDTNALAATDGGLPLFTVPASASGVPAADRLAYQLPSE